MTLTLSSEVWSVITAFIRLPLHGLVYMSISTQLSLDCSGEVWVPVGVIRLCLKIVPVMEGIVWLEENELMMQMWGKC